MKLITLYLLVFLAILVGSLFNISVNQFVDEKAFLNLIFKCCIIGGIGGCTYCLRAIYINACVKKHWDKEWHPWYFIRPFVSTICGGISFLFLSAGLLVLDAGIEESSSDLGFYAFAFIAGLNVDKFIEKLEEISQATWGIKKSRSNSGSKD